MYNKVWTQIDRFSLVFTTKISKIIPEGKFTANVRISVIYNIFVVSPRAQFDVKLLRLVVDFFLPSGAMGSFTKANLRRFKAWLLVCFFWKFDILLATLWSIQKFITFWKLHLNSPVHGLYKIDYIKSFVATVSRYFPTSVNVTQLYPPPHVKL